MIQCSNPSYTDDDDDDIVLAEQAHAQSEQGKKYNLEHYLKYYWREKIYIKNILFFNIFRNLVKREYMNVNYLKSMTDIYGKFSSKS